LAGNAKIEWRSLGERVVFLQNDEMNRLEWRRIIVFLGINLLIVTFLCWNIIFVQGKMLRLAETSYMQEQINKMEASLQELKEECQLLNTAVAHDPNVEKAFISARRSDMNELILPVFAQWQKQYRVEQIQFVSSHGIGIWDINKPLEPGDDLSYRRVINQSMEQKEKLAVIESSEAGNFIVSTAPIFRDNQFIGISELGLSLEKALGDKLKKIGPGNYAIFELDGIEENLLWEERASQLVLNTADIEKIHQGKAFYQTSADKKTMQLLVPLQDMDGITIGYIQGEISRQTFIKARNFNYLLLLLITIWMLVASLYIAGWGRFQFGIKERKLLRLTGKGKISRFKY